MRSKCVPYADAHILNTTGESRPYMIAIYAMYRSGTEAAEQRVLELCSTNTTHQGTQSAFYADLYYWLCAEAHGSTAQAQAHLHRAGLFKYGTQSDDYMWWLARVHNAVRGWPIT